MFVIAVITSVVAGSLIVFTRIFNFKMAEKIGLFEGASLNYIAGLIFSMILAFFYKDQFINGFFNVPTWAYLGGLFGVGVIVLSSYLTKRVSSFYLTLLIFLGQLITGMVIDYFVIGHVALAKILGGGLVVVGFGYNLLIDRKEEEVLSSAA